MLVFGLVASPAAAREGGRGKVDDPVAEKARVLYESGTAHYRLGEWPAALESYKEAYRVRRDPAFLFNIGQTYRQMGDAASAVAAYKSYLMDAPNAANRSDVESLINEEESALRAKDKAVAAPPKEVAKPRLGQEDAQKATVVPGSPPAARSRKWIWGLVAGAAVVVIGGSIALGVGLSRGSNEPGSTYGTVAGLP
jgi:tetratricopeptide (TPR) repeat protein